MTKLLEEFKNAGYTRKNFKGQYAIEVEAEFKNPLSTVGVEDFAITHDNSLRGYGYEFISKVPVSIDNLLEHVTKLFSVPDFIKNYKPSPRTSTHVHVNAMHWTYEQLIQFFMVYYTVEPYLMKVAGKDRESNLFCMQMHEADGVMDAVKMVIDKDWRRLTKEQTFNTYKYSALNVASIGRLGSVEFRQMRGTNDVREVTEWLRLINNVVVFALSFRSIDDLFHSLTNNYEVFFNRAIGRTIYDAWKYDHNTSNVFYIYNYYKDFPKRVATTNVKHPYNFGPTREVAEFTGGAF